MKAQSELCSAIRTAAELVRDQRAETLIGVLHFVRVVNGHWLFKDFSSGAGGTIFFISALNGEEVEALAARHPIGHAPCKKCVEVAIMFVDLQVADLVGDRIINALRGKTNQLRVKDDRVSLPATAPTRPRLADSQVRIGYSVLLCPLVADFEPSFEN